MAIAEDAHARIAAPSAPNDAVQLRASSPVCCNIWLGAPASLGHPDVSAAAKRIRRRNGAVRLERAAVGPTADRAAVDSDHAPTGAGRVRHRFEAPRSARRAKEICPRADTTPTLRSAQADWSS